MEIKTLPQDSYVNGSKLSYPILKAVFDRLKINNTKIKAGHDRVASKLIGHFVDEWDKAPIGQKQFSIDTIATSYGNCKHINLSERTIRRYWNLFLEIGFLERKERLKKGLRLWVSQTQINLFLLSERTKSPSLLTRTSNIKNKTRDVNKCVSSKNTKQEAKTQPNSSNNGEQGLGACPDLVKQFWKEAKLVLYPDTKLSIPQENALLRLLTKNFQSRQAKYNIDIKKVYQFHKKMLFKAERWFMSHPECEPPSNPYQYFYEKYDHQIRFCKIESWAKKNQSINSLSKQENYLRENFGKSKSQKLSEKEKYFRGQFNMLIKEAHNFSRGRSEKNLSEMIHKHSQFFNTIAPQLYSSWTWE